MDTTTDLSDSIKACRTCGIHFVSPSKHQLKHLFQSSQEHSEILRIRMELAQWNIEVSENDGYPQFVCNTCIHKFDQVFQFRVACINAQNEFRKFYSIPNGNIPNIKIKSERPDEAEEPSICDFIYVDELSDGEYDGATPFNIPHIPIKEAFIEAAAVPMEDSEQSINVVESASRICMPRDSSFAHQIDFVSQKENVSVSQTDAILPMSEAVECKLCQKIFPIPEDYKHHMQNVHDIRDLECHICGKEFKNSSSARLKFHMKWHTLNKQVKCNICGFVCQSKDALRVHKRINHRKLNCKICGKGVLAKKMKSHLHQHEAQEKYQCEYCTKAFGSENERENHIWHTHAMEDNCATSSMANFQTNCTHQLYDNIVNMTQEENMCQEAQTNFLYKFICAHCEQRFVNQLDLETHVREEHRSTQKTSFESKSATIVDTAQIEKTCETAQNLNEHTEFEKYDNEMRETNGNDQPINATILTHANIPPATTESNVTFTDVNIPQDEPNLTYNSSYDEDSDTIEFENETSDLSAYVDGDNLNMFACAKCSKTFSTIEQLREHHVQHLASEQHKPKLSPSKAQFQCNFCGKNFDLKFRLNRHINKHKKNAPF